MSIVKQALTNLDNMPPHQAMQRTVYWGAMSLAALLILFTSYYIQHIPTDLENKVKIALAKSPGLVPLVFVDGRRVSLRGTVEFAHGLDQDVAMLKSIPGVHRLTNQVEQEPKPSAFFQLLVNADKVDLGGKLAGSELETIVRAVKNVFSEKGIRDRIQIDDRLGKPQWIDRLEQFLSHLSPLDSITVYGWRDALFVDGVASSNNLAREIEYSLPTLIHPGVELNYQVRTRTDDNDATLSLVSGWNGTVVQAMVDSQSAANELDLGLSALTDLDDDNGVTSNIVIRSGVQLPWSVDKLSSLITALARVHDLRLESSGEKLLLWGRVDSSWQLGNVVVDIENSGLSRLVDNRLVVDDGARSPEVSLFRHHNQLIVTGRLPSQQSRRALLKTMDEKLKLDDIEDLINVEPNIAFSPWLDNWNMILPVMPDSAFGLTVSGDAVLVSGPTSSKQQRSDILRALAAMFPDMEHQDWLTTHTQ